MKRRSRLGALLILLLLPNPAICAMCADACPMEMEAKPTREAPVEPAASDCEAHSAMMEPPAPESPPADASLPAAADRDCCASAADLEAEATAATAPSSSPSATAAGPAEATVLTGDSGTASDRGPALPIPRYTSLYKLHSSFLI